MSVTIALLRAVNVAGHGLVSMATLRDLCVALGFTDAKTVLQSGNVVFSGEARPAAKLEALIETAALERLGLRTTVLVRTVRELTDVITRNPFPNEASRDPSRLVVVFLKSEPAPPAVDALGAAVAGREIVRGGGRHIYITYPDGQGRSKLTGALIEKKLGTPVTARNWNTVLKLAVLANELGR